MASSDINPSATGTTATHSPDRGVIDRVKERAAAQLSTQKDKATDGLGSVAQFVRQGTQQLRDQQHDTLAGYVEQAANQIDRFSQQLRTKDVSELVSDAQRLARRNPAVFIGSAFAVGVIGARFFKSSSQNDEPRRSDRAYGDGVARRSYSSAAAYGSSAAGSSAGVGYTSESNVASTSTPTGADSSTPVSTAAEEWSSGTAGARRTSMRRGSTPTERS